VTSLSAFGQAAHLLLAPALAAVQTPAAQVTAPAATQAVTVKKMNQSAAVKRTGDPIWPRTLNVTAGPALTGTISQVMSASQTEICRVRQEEAWSGTTAMVTTGMTAGVMITTHAEEMT